MVVVKKRKPSVGRGGTAAARRPRGSGLRKVTPGYEAKPIGKPGRPTRKPGGPGGISTGPTRPGRPSRPGVGIGGPKRPARPPRPGAGGSVGVATPVRKRKKRKPVMERGRASQ